MDIEKEGNREKMVKFAYSKVLSYTSGVTEISNFYKYLPKGQIISECLFDFLNFPKNHRNFWQISAQGSKKWSNL